jgi:hypothetical protein
MSTNLVHVLTAIGDYAGEIEAACDALLAKRVEQEPGGYGTEDWSDGDRLEIDAFCKPRIAVPSIANRLFLMRRKEERNSSRDARRPRTMPPPWPTNSNVSS